MNIFESFTNINDTMWNLFCNFSVSWNLKIFKNLVYKITLKNLSSFPKKLKKSSWTILIKFSQFESVHCNFFFVFSWKDFWHVDFEVNDLRWLYSLLFFSFSRGFDLPQLRKTYQHFSIQQSIALSSQVKWTWSFFSQNGFFSLKLIYEQRVLEHMIWYIYI